MCFLNSQVDPGATLETLKAILEAETGVQANIQVIIHNGNPLTANGALSAQGVQSGDLLMLEKALAAPQAPAGRPGAGGPSGLPIPPAQLQELLQNLRNMPQDRFPPPLREAIASGDMPTITRFLEQMMGAQARDPLEEEEERLRAAAEADPFNIDVQRRLEEIIQQRNVRENYENALEHNPEAFGSVHMLYVDTEVNGVAAKAFVDSGAQMTIMSQSFAEKCGLLRLMDRRFTGVAQGVGQTKILGRIHMAPMKLAGKHIPISITVLDGDGVKFLFGLDNLKRHQCSIDLQANVLRFPSLEVAVPFLAEHELPRDDLFQSQKEAEEQAAGVSNSGAAQAPSAPAQGSSPAATVPVPSAGGGGPSQPAGWEEKVQRLMALGFPREHCEGALKATNGNEEMAGSMLFGGF